MKNRQSTRCLEISSGNRLAKTAGRSGPRGWCSVFLLSTLAFAVHAAPITTLKVMTFNIQVSGSGAGGIPQCISAIQTAGADIVGLQECQASDAQAIANALGFYYGESGESAGLYALVSRYPVICRIGETANNYGGVGVTIELSPGQRVHLFSAHLNYTPYGPYYLQSGSNTTQIIAMENATRMAGLNELLTLASPYISLSEPVFFVGDFNAPSHLDYAALNWPESVACYGAGLVDSYRIIHPTNRTYPGPFTLNEAGITWTPNGLSSEPNGAYDRIDFIYYSTNGGATPTAATELDANNCVVPWPSDHRAVISTFSLAPAAKVAKAGSPFPPNGNTNVNVRPLLTWIPGSNAVSHNVYFGTSSPGTLQGNQAGGSFIPGRLTTNTIYYWRIDEISAGVTNTGDVWSFKTGTNFASLQPNKMGYGPGEPISIAFSNGPGNARDWIAIYIAGDAYGCCGIPSLAYLYVDGTLSGSTGKKNGTVTFSNGLPAGAYVARFFSNDGFYSMDEVAFVVTNPAPGTILTFDTLPAGQTSNQPILPGFGSNATNSSAGIAVTSGGTPHISVAWSLLNTTNRWEYDVDSVWQAVQLNEMSVGQYNELGLTPTGTAAVKIQSFNLHGYYNTNGPFGAERFTFRWDVVSGTNSLTNGIFSFLSDATKNHPVTVNFAPGNIGEKLTLRLTRITSNLGAGEVEGDKGDIAVDDISFSEIQSIHDFHLTPQSNGAMRLNFIGSPGQAYLVQAATNLTAPLWHTVTTTNASTNGAVQYIDSTAGNSPMRFYRTGQP